MQYLAGFYVEQQGRPSTNFVYFPPKLKTWYFNIGLLSLSYLFTINRKW